MCCDVLTVLLISKCNLTENLSMILFFVLKQKADYPNVALTSKDFEITSRSHRMDEEFLVECWPCTVLVRAVPSTQHLSK